MDNLTTLTGIPLGRVAQEMDRQLEPEAYRAITGGPLRNLTDISPAAALREVNRIFGPCGVGWRADYDTITYEPDTKSAFIQKAWFQYCYQDKDGNLHWSEKVCAPGYNTNSGSGIDSIKGAWTNALGTLFHMVGWQLSVYMGQRSHNKTHVSGIEEAPPLNPAGEGEHATQNGASAPPPVQTLGKQEKLHKQFHAVGTKVYGAEWDDFRLRVICPKVNVESSNDIPIDRAQAIIEGMQKAWAEEHQTAVSLAKEAELAPSDVVMYVGETGVDVKGKNNLGFGILDNLTKAQLIAFAEHVAQEREPA